MMTPLSLRTMVITAIATMFFGFTDYGKQTLNSFSGTHEKIENEVEILTGVANDYVRAIAPPPKTHGYSPYESIGLFVLMYAMIFGIRILLNQIIRRVYQNRKDCEEHTRWVTWNMISILFTSIVGTYGLLMTRNVLLVFWREFWTVISSCGISGFFFDCPTGLVSQYIVDQSMTPLTYQLIHSMDYVSHSSQVMFISVLMIAYFMYDLTVNRPSAEYVFHHLLALGCVSIYIWNETYAFYVATAMVTELSTIFLAASSMLDRKGWTKAIVMAEFAITFFFCRIVLITTILLMVWFNETGQRFWIATTAFTIFGALNYYWFYLIVRKVIRVFKSVISQ